MRDRRAREGQLLADPAQAEQQDPADREVRVHVRAGDAHLQARRRGRDRRWRDDADRRRARVIPVRDRVRRPERLAADEALVAVDRRDELCEMLVLSGGCEALITYCRHHCMRL